MKLSLLVIFYGFLFTALSQEVIEMKPELGLLVDKSPEGEIESIREKERCEDVLRMVSNQEDLNNLSEEDLAIYQGCTIEREDYYDVIGIGCSWYCGGGQDTNSASSELKTFRGITYRARNIHDLSYKTAWIEGVPGYGIGESITYHFPPRTPRITEIIVVNGYVKSDKSWRENSRVKKLMMYVNDKAVAVLSLEDIKREQHFRFEPMGYGERADWAALQKLPWWTIRFEIMEVYPGDKYDDTAITEIYFDGIDVH